jgi:riboflavin biosynthesis pyrimidine reductase
MSSLAPFLRLLDPPVGAAVPLPASLAQVYGPLRLPAPRGGPRVLTNFASTLDGIVALDLKGHAGGADISGSDPHDRWLMGLLRSVADYVMVGAGTLRSVPHHLWTGEHIYPQAAGAFRALRSSLQLSPQPVNVIVTARGDVDLRLPVFASGKVRSLVLTTAAGARRLSAGKVPPFVQVRAVGRGDRLSARSILHALPPSRATPTLLLEGGPHLLGDFLSEGLVDELFLTLAPQIAGRDPGTPRLGLVEGRTFAPGHPLWGRLWGIRQAGDHLFLRLRFPSPSGGQRKGE